MPRTSGPWAIYDKADLRESRPEVYSSDGPPSDWGHTWESVFDQTEFPMDHNIRLCLLAGPWQGHGAGAVVVENWTTGELAIWRGVRNVVEIREKAPESA